jgi:hypothetical protein
MRHFLNISLCSRWPLWLFLLGLLNFPSEYRIERFAPAGLEEAHLTRLITSRLAATQAGFLGVASQPHRTVRAIPPNANCD